jgi:hypothetical protein
VRQIGSAGFAAENLSTGLKAYLRSGGIAAALLGLCFSNQGYINLKGYKEFAAENRPNGWNVWLTFVISPAARQEAAAKKAMITK